MAEKIRISLAERNIEIQYHNRLVYKLCKDYISCFSIPDFVISTTVEELKKEVANLPPIEKTYAGVITTRYYGDAESAIICERIAEWMLLYNTFLMHGAVVAYKKSAYMFLAPSGTGKTTRLKLWLDAYPDSYIVNGDKPLIKISDSQAIACGTPWCGKEGYNTNTMVALRAIFLIERACGDEEPLIKEISAGKAFPTLFQQAYRPKDKEKLCKTIDLIKDLEGRVKFFYFRSNPTVSAIRLAYEMARPR